MHTLNGLPAHVLLVHAIVVLLPLSAILLVLSVASGRVRTRFAGANAILSVLVLVLVPITTGAGEWLQEHTEDTALVRRHADLGGTAVWVALPVAVLAIVVWWRSLETATGTTQPLARRFLPERPFLAPASSTVSAVLAVLCVVAAGAAVYDIYRIGDSGAKASWQDRVTSGAAPDGG